MKGVNFPESNFVFTRPESMTEDECYDLHVHKGEFNGMPYIISKWELTEEELKMIAETKHVYLMIIGSGMPPVSIHVESPFVEPEIEQP